MKFKLATVRKIFFVAIFASLVFLSGYSVGKAGFVAELANFPRVHITRITPVKDLDFALFWKVWDTINNSYYDKSKVKKGDMVYGAIRGMVASLGDPYTLFLTPSDNKVSNEDLQGNFSGVGIQIGFKGTQLVVIAPLPESPAEKAGVKAGDLIMGIKDTSKGVDIGTANINLQEAVQHIRGQKGTKVTLTLMREGSDKPIVVDLVREQINVPSVTLKYTGKNNEIAHLSILKFGAETPGEWQKSVNEIAAKGDSIKGIVLDLRNNPGGYLQDAVDIAGEFLEANSVAVIQATVDTQIPLKTDREGRFINAKVVVLVNGGSASASEILAGALRDNKKIKLIGEKTFGKGTIQEPQELDGGAGLHITIAKWLTPNGTWVHDKGLEPDDKVEDKADTEEDEQLLEAVKVLSGSF